MEEEVKKDIAGSSKQAWGSTPATREWLTKVIVRAINKQAEADNAADELPAFKDADEISDGYAGYINVAKTLGIVSGVTVNEFDPTGTVTRAQMAAFLSKAERHLPSRNAHIVMGTLQSLGSSTITLQTRGSSQTLTLMKRRMSQFSRRICRMVTIYTSLVMVAKLIMWRRQLRPHNRS